MESSLSGWIGAMCKRNLYWEPRDEPSLCNWQFHFVERRFRLEGAVRAVASDCDC